MIYSHVCNQDEDLMPFPIKDKGATKCDMLRKSTIAQPWMQYVCYMSRLCQCGSTGIMHGISDAWLFLPWDMFQGKLFKNHTIESILSIVKSRQGIFLEVSDKILDFDWLLGRLIFVELVRQNGLMFYGLKMDMFLLSMFPCHHGISGLCMRMQRQ